MAPKHCKTVKLGMGEASAMSEGYRKGVDKREGGMGITTCVMSPLE